jgi:colanic acid/amylovoran biosynthesis protein
VNSLFSAGVKRRDYLFGLLGLSRPVSELARDMDLVVVLGGDDFTEDYGRLGPIVNSLKLGLVNRSGPPVVLVAQTMGPYTWWLRCILGILLRGLFRIYARERETHSYLLRMGLSNVALGYDLALLPLARQTQSATSLGAYVVFCPSQMSHKYAIAGDLWTSVEENVAIVEGLPSRFPRKGVVILVRVLRLPDSDDRIMVRAIVDQLPPDRSQRVVGRDENLLPYEVRALIQQSHLVASSRMHRAISAIQLRVPTIAIAYNSKY